MYIASHSAYPHLSSCKVPFSTFPLGAKAPELKCLFFFFSSETLSQLGGSNLTKSVHFKKLMATYLIFPRTFAFERGKLLTYISHLLIEIDTACKTKNCMV